MEDLDRVQASAEHEASQLRDLEALGLDWDGGVVRQSERFERYEAAIGLLTGAGLTYPCYCSRREVREASAAPQGEQLVSYPGTCRGLSLRERARRDGEGRRPALRLLANIGKVTVVDDLLGPLTATVDDVVLRRADGVPAYNLAVVVDDAAQRVEQVVRGDDLATSAPRQRHLASLLGLPPVRYAHVPLVLAPGSGRLAKRDGAVTLADQASVGRGARAVCTLLAASLGLADGNELVAPGDLVAGFDPAGLPRGPWTPGAWAFDPDKHDKSPEFVAPKKINLEE